jgi:hypothetical protein
MSADGANATAMAAALRSVWKAATPTRQEFGVVVSELQSMQMVGEGSIFEREAHVNVTRMAFLKPPATAFLSELKVKDRRSAKEYFNAVGVWLELGQAAMALARNGEDDMTPAAMTRMVALADKALERPERCWLCGVNTSTTSCSTVWKRPDRWCFSWSRATKP